MNKKRVLSLFLFILGFILVTVSYVYQKFNYRILLNIIGLVIITCGFFVKNNRVRNIPFFAIFVLIISLFLDSLISITFSRIPIFSYGITTHNNSRVYNAIGFRVWDCEGKDIKVDKLYQLGYYCDVSDMEEINSNAFLGEIVDKYHDYENKYIKINGKISRKEGISYIEMQSYQANEITLNGYVTFSDDITLRIVFKNGTEELNGYDIYDNITVAGRIWYMRKTDDDKYIVYMDDSKVVGGKNYDDYNIVVSEKKDCTDEKKLLHSSGDYSLYSVCLDNVIVNFEHSVYEIGSVLSSGKLNIDKILDNAKYKNVNLDETKTLYVFENFNIIKCGANKVNDIVIGGPKLSFDQVLCSTKQEIEE